MECDSPLLSNLLRNPTFLRRFGCRLSVGMINASGIEKTEALLGISPGVGVWKSIGMGEVLKSLGSTDRITKAIVFRFYTHRLFCAVRLTVAVRHHGRFLAESALPNLQ